MEAVGDIFLEDDVLVIKRIAVHYRLKAPEDKRELIERVNGFHARFCPVARSIAAAIDISTTVELV